MTNTRIIDIRTITEDGPQVRFTATPKECRALAERFDLPCLRCLLVDGCFSRSDDIFFDGQMHIEADRICGVTLNRFLEKTDTPLHLMFTKDDSDEDSPPEIDVFRIERGKIDLWAVFSELLGLNLNPFPKSTSDCLDYRDPDDTADENPFAVLAKLKK